MSKIIKETPDYILQTGTGLEAPHSKCYQLINKVYDIVEVETQLLPQAFEYIEQIQAALDAKRDIEKEMAKAVKAGSAPIVQFPH